MIVNFEVDGIFQMELQHIKTVGYLTWIIIIEYYNCMHDVHTWGSGSVNSWQSLSMIPLSVLMKYINKY